MPVPVLTARGISLVYRDGDILTYALRSIDVTIEPNTFVGIMGPSGSGKSSLLYILSGLKRCTEGEVSLGDLRYEKRSERDMMDLRRHRFGFVFQQPYLINWQTSLENVMMGSPAINTAAFRRADDYFDRLGITKYKNKFPSQLSGGEKQRVCVARAMMNEPDIIFADEPTASLDHANGHLVVDLLRSYKEHGSVVIVTHDPEMLSDADTTLLLRDGRQQAGLE